MNDYGGLSVIDAFAVNLTATALANYISTVTLEELASFVKGNKDMAADIPTVITLPNFPMAKVAVVKYLKNVDDRLYEHVRYRLSSQFPQHAALLGLDSVTPWYYQNMNRVKQRLISELQRGGEKNSELKRQDVANSSIGGSSVSGSRPVGVLLHEEVNYSVGHSIPDQPDGGPFSLDNPR
jgi:hypothetical protein